MLHICLEVPTIQVLEDAKKKSNYPAIAISMIGNKGIVEMIILSFYIKN